MTKSYLLVFAIVLFTVSFVISSSGATQAQFSQTFLLPEYRMYIEGTSNCPRYRQHATKESFQPYI
jgi:hypothetical protein